jgi:hypothetical protein
VQEEMRHPKSRLEAMEDIQIINPDVGDICEGETSDEEHKEVTKEYRVLRMLLKLVAGLKWGSPCMKEFEC